MTRQLFPDSQKEPLGPNQIKYINAVYGKAFFRDAAPIVQPCMCRLPEQVKAQ
jgi:hypothetical protein